MYGLAWIITLVTIGSLIGFFTKPSSNTWYLGLNQSSLTPASYIFGIVWPFLYATIAIFGWALWTQKQYNNTRLIKVLYCLQLLLNWSWPFLFFTYSALALSVICIIFLDITVGLIIYLQSKNEKIYSLLLTPYMGWLLFATYLNSYIWYYN